MISPFTDIAVGNTPPVLRFEQDGSARSRVRWRTSRPRPRGRRRSSTPLPLTRLGRRRREIHERHERAAERSRAPPVSAHVVEVPRPGAVTFDKAKPAVEKLPGGDAPFNGKATTTAKFSEPGDYVLHVTANDYSGDGGGGFGCCWTTALVKVAVK